ncbi:MAG: CBU_1594 family Dot/Icm type IV secretion system effector [Gammaproteobacteria bacterium]|nr:MAG: CBU_1594 family Dot/Icm type IV secretion system effector [Gammaproteobacteria bacterium]
MKHDTKERIASDAIQAMRDKDVVRKDTLRMLRAAIQRREVDERTELDEAQVLAVIEKQVKQARDSISQFIEGGRQDLADKEQNELDVLIGYLPEQMSVEEIHQHIKSVIEQTGASSMKDMGMVMGALKPLLQGKADMAAVSKIIKDQLQS